MNTPLHKTILFCCAALFSTVGAPTAFAEEPVLVPLAEGPLPEAPPQPSRSQDDVSSERVVRGLISIKLGVGTNVLGQPDDPSGADTILSGSGLTGNGFMFGVTYELPPLTPPVLFETGLLVDYSSATGFEEFSDRRRDVQIKATAIRVPLWAKARLPATEHVSFVASGGLDLVYGVGSSSTVREENIPAADQLVLETTSVLSAYLVLAAGLELNFDHFVVPLVGQFDLNPLSGDTTPERFDDYSSATDRGHFRVEYDYQFIGTVGLGYRL